jgi:hypothetical protein
MIVDTIIKASSRFSTTRPLVRTKRPRLRHQETRSYRLLGYPWRRLGYTYDWGGSQGDIGLSEFVIEAGANVEVASVTTTDCYLR